MKTLTLTFCAVVFLFNSTNAQKYIGKDWPTVQYELAAKKAQNDKLYVELSDRDSLNHVYHTIELVENDSLRNRVWTLISTHFNDKGICNMEFYTDLKTKSKAVQKALKLLPGCKITYSSSTDHGRLDNYVVTKGNKILNYLELQIGSTDLIPNDIMIFLTNRNLK